MHSAGNNVLFSFQTTSHGGGPAGIAGGPAWRRPRRTGNGMLPVLALIAWGLGMVVLTQWLHPAGPTEDPLVTQELLLF